MEEKTNPERHLLVLPRRAPEAAVHGDGTEELRIHHPGAEVRSGAARGNDSQPGVPELDHVSRGDVFWRLGRRQWRHQFGQRRHTLPIAIAVHFWLTIIFTGCGTPRWQQLYDDSKLKLHQGYYDAAIREAADGYLKTQRKKDVAWSWRFRILKAEGLMRNRMAEQAAALLAEDPPQNLPLHTLGRTSI